MTSLLYYILFFGYDYTGFLGYRFNETLLHLSNIFGIIENIFVTFLHEGSAATKNGRPQSVKLKL